MMISVTAMILEVNMNRYTLYKSRQFVLYSKVSSLVTKPLRSVRRYHVILVLWLDFEASH